MNRNNKHSESTKRKMLIATLREAAAKQLLVLREEELAEPSPTGPEYQDPFSGGTVIGAFTKPASNLGQTFAWATKKLGTKVAGEIAKVFVGTAKAIASSPEDLRNFYPAADRKIKEILAGIDQKYAPILQDNFKSLAGDEDFQSALFLVNPGLFIARKFASGTADTLKQTVRFMNAITDGAIQEKMDQYNAAIKNKTGDEGIPINYDYWFGENPQEILGRDYEAVKKQQEKKYNLQQIKDIIAKDTTLWNKINKTPFIQDLSKLTVGAGGLFDKVFEGIKNILLASDIDQLQLAVNNSGLNIDVRALAQKLGINLQDQATQNAFLHTFKENYKTNTIKALEAAASKNASYAAVVNKLITNIKQVGKAAPPPPPPQPAAPPAPAPAAPAAPPPATPPAAPAT